MKIAQVVHSFPPDTGGIEGHTYNLAKGMAARGHEVTVFTSKPKGAKNDELVDGFRVRRFPYINVLSLSSVRIIPFLTLHLLRADADVYHSHGYGSLQPFCAAVAAKIRGKPFVFTLHGYPKMEGPMAVMQWLYKNTLARFYLWAASSVISVASANITNIAAEVDGRKIRVIHNGVDMEMFKCKNGITKAKNRIVYVGRLDKYKGIDSLVRAFARIKTEFPDAELSLVGRDEGIKQELEGMANQLGIKINFSEANESEMPNIYDDAAAVVLPSKYEGMSLVILEAIACERPMLSTKVGEAPSLFKEVYRKHAHLLLFDTEEELAWKIRDVLKNKARYEAIAAGARKRLVEKYSWGMVCDETLKVYERVMRA
ncbi:MAG: glycosyltransferase family 4 protein [Candidatus Micrarchaeota archaeon]|nr:glycosyltransferase family 4 protein [Candidatus Micrarchaeota archaeon]